MDMIELRRKLYSKYPGEKWKKRVGIMTDNQVIAVSRSIAERDEKRKAKEPKQLSLFFDELVDYDESLDHLSRYGD